MKHVIIAIAATGLLAGCVNHGMAGAPKGAAHRDAIASAKSAAPASIADDATIVAMDGTVLQAGSNGYTCRPDNPNNVGADPMCLDASWMNLLGALSSNEEPDYSQVGVAYMLAGDAEVSNTDPYASEFTNDEDWVAGLGAHLMIVVPGEDSLAGFSTDPHSGGPWIMWPGTPYEHLMVPIDSYGN